MHCCRFAIGNIYFTVNIMHEVGLQHSLCKFKQVSDQIWLNYATLANFQKSLAMILSVYLESGKTFNLLWNFLCVWAEFHCFKRPNIK